MQLLENKMYILNPTEEQLNSWYKTDKSTGEYLIYKCNYPVIHINGGDYYFVSTTDLIDCIYKLPILVKIKSFINTIKNINS